MLNVEVIDAHQPGEASKIDQQVDQVLAIINALSPTVDARGVPHITIDVDDKTSVHPLKAKRGSIPYARQYVASLYYDAHRHKMPIGAYNRAVDRLTLQAAKQRTPADEKPLPLDMLHAFIASHGLKLPARDITASYYLVNEPVSHRGIWRMAGRKTCRLIDCFVEIIRIQKPAPTSTSKDYAVTLRFTNPHDQPLELTLTRQDLLFDDALASHFLGYGSLPETTLHKQFLLEALKELMRLPDVLVQLQTDALGWSTLEDGSLVWIDANGVETESGFTPASTAPYVAPTCLSPGYGYYGQDALQPTDDIMRALLTELLPAGQTMIAALFGLAARIQLPIPDDSAPGTMRFCSEIIGPTRHGKSRLLNALLSLFGTRFEYDKGTLLNYYGGSDSGLGRLLLASHMRYQLFADFDHKVSPGDSLFEAIHKIRAVTNNIYADDTGGGTVSTQRGGMRTRAKPAGALIRTSNYDHVQYSARNDQENIEARVCSFVWPIDAASDSGYQRADDVVSHQIEENRLGIYAWGVAYRRWLMKQQQAGTLSVLIEQNTHMARDIAYNGKWGCDLHRNQTVELTLGLLMFVEFLQEEYPSSFMVSWILDQLDQVLADRVARCCYVHTLAGNHTDQRKLDEFVTSTIRSLLTSQQGYVTSQQGAFLHYTDAPSYQLDQLGYRRTYNTNEGGVYDPGRLEIGHLVPGMNALALKTTLVYDALKKEAERVKLQLPDKDTLLQHMVSSGIAIAAKDGKSTCLVKVRHRPGRYLLISLDTLYPPDQDVNADVETDETIPETSTLPSNVTVFPSPSDVPVVRSDDSSPVAKTTEPDTVLAEL